MTRYRLIKKYKTTYANMQRICTKLGIEKGDELPDDLLPEIIKLIPIMRGTRKKPPVDIYEEVYAELMKKGQMESPVLKKRIGMEGLDTILNNFDERGFLCYEDVGKVTRKKPRGDGYCKSMGIIIKPFQALKQEWGMV